jgi:hypothetical protein
MRAGTLVRHEPACIKNPVNYARIREALFSGDGVVGVTYSRYLELSAADKTLPSLNTLIRQSKSAQWGNVLAFFKLSLPSPETHQEDCQQKRATPKRAKRAPKPKRTTPKPKPVEPTPAAVAYAIAPPAEREVSLPLPRIVPTVSKWAGLKGYDPTWKAPTGDTQWLVQVQPGERTCLACGETFEPGGYCMRCGTKEDGTRRAPADMPPSVATAEYLYPEEYVTVR